MFRGVDTINLDGKGRFAIPTKYRATLIDHCEGKLVVNADRDLSPFLVIFPQPLWEEAERKLKKIPTFNKKAQRFKRFFLGNSAQCDMDGHGRVLIPEKLRTFARLEKKIVLSSQIDRFQIWAEDAWDAGVNDWLSEDTDQEDLAEEFGDFVI